MFDLYLYFICSTSDLLKTEEAAKKLDDDLAGLSRRLHQLEAAVKARDKEIERLQRVSEQAEAEAAEAVARRVQAEEQLRQAEEGVLAVR